MDIVEFQFTPTFVHSVATHLITCVIMWVLVVSATFIDLWDRIYTQNKLKKPITSHLMRKTMGKVGEYWRFLLIALIIDAIVFISCALLGVRTFPIVTMLFSAALLIIETKSLVEHARERKSNVEDMQRIIQSVVNAASDRDAKKVIQCVAEYIGEDRKATQKEKREDN